MSRSYQPWKAACGDHADEPLTSASQGLKPNFFNGSNGTTEVVP